MRWRQSCVQDGVQLGEWWGKRGTHHSQDGTADSLGYVVVGGEVRQYRLWRVHGLEGGALGSLALARAMGRLNVLEVTGAGEDRELRRGEEVDEWDEVGSGEGAGEAWG